MSIFNKMYNCPRCSYQTEIKACYKSHIFREKICPPEKGDISLEEERKRINFKQANYKCEKCNKPYASRSGYYIHKKECNVEPHNNDMTKQMFSQFQSAMSSFMHPQMYGYPYNMGYSPFIPVQSQISPQPLAVVQPQIVSQTPQTLVETSQHRTKKHSSTEFTFDFGPIRNMGTEDISPLINEQELFEHCFSRGEEGLFDMIKTIWFDDITCNRNVKYMDQTKVTYLSVRGEITTRWDRYLVELFVTLDNILEQIVAKNKISKNAMNSFIREIGDPLGFSFYSDIINFNEDEKRKKEIYEYIKTRLLET